MRSKVFFLGIVAFWLVMNYLLWRSQWGPHSRIGNSVPVAVVWDKILTAPDASSLEIYDHDKSIGRSRWTAVVGNSAINSAKELADEYAPEENAPAVTGYTLNFDGNLSLTSAPHLRFEMTLNLATNRNWKDFRLHVSERPSSWDIRATAATEKINLKVEGDEGGWQKTFTFSDLSHPETLLADLGGPVVGAMAAGMGLPMSSNAVGQASASLAWQAHEDWMQFGHSKVRVYRVETRWMGQPIFVFISRVGEILWVELPNKITLRNEAFSHF